MRPAAVRGAFICGPVGHAILFLVMARNEDDDVISASSFRGDAKASNRNLEIPGLALTHHPGMTVSTARDDRSGLIRR
jgi:hypothetical protein